VYIYLLASAPASQCVKQVQSALMCVCNVDSDSRSIDAGPSGMQGVCIAEAGKGFSWRSRLQHKAVVDRSPCMCTHACCMTIYGVAGFCTCIQRIVVDAMANFSAVRC
jgi:hypothetical protein